MSALGVTGTATDPVALEQAQVAMREWAGRTLLYAVGVERPVWEYGAAAQVASAPARLEFPWGRGEAATAEHAEAIGAELHELLQQCPTDGTLEAQLTWYRGPAGHARLRFNPLTLEAQPAELDDRRLLDCIA